MNFKFGPGTDVMIFAENLAKIFAFFAQTTVSFCKNVIITLFFEKNAIFFAKNRQKSQKIVIITSTPGFPDGMFSYQNTNLGNVWSALKWKMLL
jgi:uncharacterized membrane-anchored protein